MKKKYISFLIFFISFIISVLYLYYFRPLTDDEIFNYGFANNILSGLIPYRDFNMIILPFFSYLLSFILLFLGKKLIVYHMLISIFIGIITCCCFKKIGYRAFVIYLLLLIYPYTGYNMFCLFLFMIMLFICDKNLDILEAILISMMFLTKQTLILLIIPSIMFAKNRKKVFSIYLISILILVMYLLIFNNLYEALDYCFLGMFDFTSKNNTGVGGFILLELVILSFLIYSFYKDKNKYLLYLVMFQIIVFPIVDYFHFVIGFIPIVYYLLVKYNDKRLFNLYVVASVVTFFILLNCGIMFEDDTYLYLEHYDVSNFMKGRSNFSITKFYISDIEKTMDYYDNYKVYILSNYSYLIKLNLEIPINKYDIINYGNMGYDGSNRYIREMDDYCSNRKCIFFINGSEIVNSDKIQTDQRILNYVLNNYTKVTNSNVFNAFIN